MTNTCNQIPTGSYDDESAFVVCQSRPGILTVYQKNPDQAVGILYGVPYSQMSSVLRTSVNREFGTPPAPPPPTYGVAGKSYRVIYATRLAGLGAITEYRPGPVRIDSVNPIQEPNCTGTGVWTWGVGTAQQGSAQFGYSDLRGPNGQCNQPTFGIEESTTPGQQVPAVGGGYPPLTEAEIATLVQQIADLSAVAFRWGFSAGGPLLAAEIRARIPQAPPITRPAPFPRLEERLDGTSNRLTQLEQELERVKTDVTSILNCTCLAIYQDCLQLPITGLPNAIQYLIGQVCRLLELTGLFPGPYQIPDTNRTAATLADLHQETYNRIGLAEALTLITCGFDTDVNSIEQFLTAIFNVIDFGPGTVSGEDSQGNPITQCTVRQALQAALDAGPGEDAYFVGFPGDRPPTTLLKIRYDEAGRRKSRSVIQVPAVDYDVTWAQIAAVAGPRRLGDWLCMINLQGGYRIYNWAEDRDTGLAYCRALASLSSLPQVLGSEAATYNPSDAPRTGRNRDLVAIYATLVPPENDLREKRTIRP